MNPLINVFRRGVTPETTPTPTAPSSFMSEPASDVITAKVIQRELVDRSDRLIAEARTILAAKPEPTERAMRLAKLGFNSTPEVEEKRRIEIEVQMYKRTADLYERNALKYPSLKFIDEKTMEAVCKKYGLLVGELRHYTGLVPDWVLDRIEQCGVDVILHEVRKSGTRGNMAWGGDSRSFHTQAVITDNMYADADKANAAVKALGFDENGYPLNYVVTHNLMCIAAPAAEMRLMSNERVEGHRIVRVHEDPIISIRVQGGYCVIAAWGEEGSDPQVFNVANN